MDYKFPVTGRCSQNPSASAFATSESFSVQAGEVLVLDDLSFHLNERDFVTSSARRLGKTTVFNITAIAGRAAEPDSKNGSMHYQRRVIESLRAARLLIEGPTVSLANRALQVCSGWIPARGTASRPT